MKSILLLLFIFGMQGHSFGQPGLDKLAYAKNILYEAERIPFECPSAVYPRLFKGRAALMEIISDTLKYSSIKVAKCLFDLQYYIYIYEASCLRQPVAAERAELFLRFKNYYLKKSPKWVADQQDALGKMKLLLYAEWDVAKSKGATEQFLEDPGNREWFDAENGSAAVERLLMDLEIEKDLYRKREMLQSANIDVASFCKSIFSYCDCESIDKAVQAVNAAIEEMESRQRAIEKP